MNLNCACGGRFKRTDIVPVMAQGRLMYRDTDQKVAHWRCDKCGSDRTQRKRQVKRQPTPVLAHGLEVAYYVSDEKYVYGPFTAFSDSEIWAEDHTTFGPLRYFSLGKLQQIGNPQRADSVGAVYSHSSVEAHSDAPQSETE